MVSCRQTKWGLLGSDSVRVCAFRAARHCSCSGQSGPLEPSALPHGKDLIKQVERIGVSAGHLPSAYPFLAPTGLASQSDDVLFESSDNGLSDDDDDEQTGDEGQSDRARLSNQQLVDAMGDVKKFRNLYLGMTKKAMSAYEACGKVNSVVRLKADMAALAL
jgi:hypothetical protein